MQDIHENKAPPNRGELKQVDDIVIFRKLFNIMPQLGWTAQPDGWIDFYNQGWYDYTGSNYEEMQGWGWQKVHDPNYLHVCMDAWTHALNTGTPCEVEFPLRRHDGVFRWFLTRMNPLRNSEGKIVRWVGINTDIQDQKDKEIEEKRRSDALADLDKAKTVFFNNISHEFRTPLTLILGPLEAVLSTALADDIRLELHTVQRNAMRLLRLVNTLLDFSRIEAGRFQASFGPTDISSFTAELSSLFRSAIEHAGLIYEVQCDPLSELAYIDRDMWEKIICNLISNALKFTLTGKISLRLYEDATNFLFTISDTGIGISDSEQSAIFQRFYRAKTDASRTHEGTGIGLSLVSEFVKMHGGSVDLKSKPSEGSTFVVKIPKGHSHLPGSLITMESLTQADVRHAQTFIEESSRWTSAPTGANLVSLAWSTARNSTLLLVDDNADMCEYLERFLSQFWNVQTACNGQDALEIIERRVPDLLITDVMMPKLDGFQLLKVLRKRDDAKNMPIILLSAKAGEEARVESLELGADEYLVKPFSTKELVVRVNSLLQKHMFAKDMELAVTERTRDLKEKQELLEITADKLFHSNKELKQLTSVAAHDLQEPLRTILVFLDRLLECQGSTLSQEGRKYLSCAIDGAQLMRELIQDLLLCSRVGTEGQQFLSTSVQQVLQATLGVLQGALSETGGKVIVDGELPIVMADGRQLAQLFQNLISNALKYRSQDAPIIRLSVKQLDDEWLFSLSDNGIGIDMQHAHRIFVIFQRLHNRNKYSGRGIGLTICKQIVERHGGKIWIDSKPNQGSTFFFTLRKLPIPAVN